MSARSESARSESALPERVGAFILRKTADQLYELLLFQHPDCKEAPIQVPGGGIEPGESIEAALYREIYEESGLADLTITRKLGISERCWLAEKRISRRHYFLLEVSSFTPDRWEHIVHGHGADAGYRFSYFWHRPAIDFVLMGSARSFLNPHFIPELYDAT